MITVFVNELFTVHPDGTLVYASWRTATFAICLTRPAWNGPSGILFSWRLSIQCASEMNITKIESESLKSGLVNGIFQKPFRILLGPQSFLFGSFNSDISSSTCICFGITEPLGNKGAFQTWAFEKNQGCLFLRAFVHPLTNRSLWQKGSGLHMSNMCFREFWPAMRACSEHVIRVQRCCVSIRK